MPIDIPTLFVVLVATSLSLCLAIGTVAQRADRDGLSSCTGALALHALAYFFYALRGRIPDLLSIGCANVALACTYVLLTHAVGVFQKRRIARAILFGPMLVVALGYLFFMKNIGARTVIFSLVFLGQALVLLRYLIEARRRTAGRGQYLVIAGLLVNAMLMGVRNFVALTGAESIRSISDATPSQAALYLSVLVTLNLIAFGFVLMTKERADEKTRQMAMKDKLTDCWNRFRIEEVAQQEMHRLARYGTPVSLIMIDLDFFKAVNDQHGHGVGDLILKDFAATVQSCIRNTDVLGRWGGEEFIVLLPSSSYFVTAAIAERIRAAVEAGEHPNGIRLTASLGFSSCQSSDSWDDWLGRADQALYRAKAGGRNRVEAEMPLFREDSPSAVGVARLVWSREYETGNRTLDRQHRQLFVRANQLLGAMIGGASRQQIADRVQPFIAEMEEHMRDEEALLEKLDYPDREEHAVLHRRLIERARSLLARYAGSEIELAELLHFVIYEFSAQHLLIEDGKYAPFVQRVSLAGR